MGEEKLAKSVIECRRLEAQIDSLKNKILEKENKNDGANKKKRTFKIFEKSKEQLQTELSSTQNKLKQEISNRDRLKAQLQQKSKYRDVLFSKVITDFIRYEEYRLKMNKYIYCIYAKINEEALMKMHSLTLELQNNVKTINIKQNIQKFVLENRSSHNIPKIVLDHAIFKISQDKNDIFDNTIKNISKILQPFIDKKMNVIFDYSAKQNEQLLDFKRNSKHSDHQQWSSSHSKPRDVTLTYMKSMQCPNMSLPKLKKVSSNQDITKHLLEYVTKHSMKGGKHSRIDSLHSINRQSHKKTSIVLPSSSINEIKEDKADNVDDVNENNQIETEENNDSNQNDDDKIPKNRKVQRTFSNVQRLQQQLFEKGLSVNKQQK